MRAVPLRAGAGFLDPVSESESQMDLSGFFAFGAGGFLGLGAASEGFLAAVDHRTSQVVNTWAPSFCPLQSPY